MKTIVTAVFVIGLSASFVIGLSASAFAQVSPERRIDKKPGKADPLAPEQISQLIVGPRISAIGGRAFDPTAWSTIYGIGFGLQVDYASLYQVDKSTYVGFYLGASIDEFTGKKEDLGGGDKTTPDNLDIIGLEIGPLVRENFGSGCFFEAHMGIGGAFYTHTGIETVIGGVKIREGFIDSSSAFLFDAGVRVGVALSKSMDLAAGLQYQINGAPDSSPDFGLNFKNQGNVVFSITLNIDF
jgi:hypothetical protein